MQNATTTLLGPYDDLGSSDKVMMSGAIPRAVRERLFTIAFPRRGAIDKIITRSLYMLDAYLATHPELNEFDEYTREVIVTNYFNSIISHLQTLDPKTLLPEPV
jgi:hypothetical protein